MAVTAEFMEAVRSGKMMRVRIMMKDSLLIDPTGAQFNEMERYASERMGDLYVKHDGEHLNFEVSSWNKDYLNRQMVLVVNNFSRERVDLLKSIVRYLYKEKANKIRENRDQHYNGNTIRRKHAGAGVATAGAALAVVGICTSHTVLIAGGAAAAAVGVAMIVTDKE